jgi:sulfite exporter TauE/SafE
MLNIFSFFKAIRIKQPHFFMLSVNRKSRKSRSPFFIGMFSGFILGCGPLQAMYVMAAGNGNVLDGAKFLALFGLGTLPILLSFGLIARLLSSKMTRSVIRTSGIILIILGTMMLNNGILRAKSGNEMNPEYPGSCCHSTVDKK